MLLLYECLTGPREDDAVVSYHPDPPQLLRARLRLALHSRGGEDLNRLVHHERGRYSSPLALAAADCLEADGWVSDGAASRRAVE